METSHPTNESKSANVEVPTSGQHFGNALLSTALSSSEKIWFGRFVTHCRKNGRRYAVTWHMRLELSGFTTARINYALSKLVKKGLLKKETNKYCTKFYYDSDFA